MAHYILNFIGECGAERASSREVAAACLRAGMGGPEGEKHRSALAAGDVVLAYVGAPVREFIGRATVASPVRAWTPTEAQALPSPSEAQALPGQPSSGVLLTDIEEWDPPVRMTDVLRLIDPSEGARADLPAGVVRITENEYEAALAVASGRRTDRLRGVG